VSKIITAKSGQNSLYQGVSVNNLKVEQGCVIKFLTDEGVPGIEIICRLRNHYEEKAHSGTQMRFWINEVKGGEPISKLLQALG
jgi:hypothetical protein